MSAINFVWFLCLRRPGGAWKRLANKCPGSFLVWREKVLVQGGTELAVCDIRAQVCLLACRKVEAAAGWVRSVPAGLRAPS